MSVVLMSFGAVFLLVASGGMLLLYRESMTERVSAVVNPRVKSDVRDTLQQTGVSLTDLVGRLEKLLPNAGKNKPKSQQRLVRAGFRGESAMKVLSGAKVLMPISVSLLALSLGVMSLSPMLCWTICLGGGYIVPDFWLGRMVKRRQKKIRLGLPDTLDFMVICIEAGLSLDHATTRTAEELRTVHPEISDELDMVLLETRAGRPRSDAWKQFGERTGVETVRVLASILIQAEQLGTSVSKTLRVQSEALRTKRRQQIEEKAAKTTVKLVFPLVLCIFPSLFVVMLAPSVIIMAESFGSYFPH